MVIPVKKPRKKNVEPKETVKSITTDTIGPFTRDVTVDFAKEEVEAKPKLPRGMVKVKVCTGTLSFEGGTYEKGEVFTVSKKRLKGFDSRFFEIIK